MRREALAMVIGATLFGCRAVVGVEDLTLDRADAQATDGAALVTADGAPREPVPDGDTGSDAGEVSPPGADAREADGAAVPPEAGGAQCSGTRPECLKCCRDAHQTANPVLEGFMRSTGCLCGSGGCALACASSSCATPPAAPGMGTCVQCLDPLVFGATCAGARQQCTGDSVCRPLAQCVAACP